MPNNFFFNQYKLKSSEEKKDDIKDGKVFFKKDFTEEIDKNEKTDNSGNKTIGKPNFEKISKNDIIDEKINRALKTENYTKTELSAFFLILLGSNKASKVIQSFDDSELEKICLSVLSVDSMNIEMKNQVEKAFGRVDVDDLSSREGGKDFLRALLNNAYGIQKGSNLFVKYIELYQQNNLQFLQSLSAQDLKELLDSESQFIVPAVLSQLTPTQAAELIKLYPKERSAALIKALSSENKIENKILDKALHGLREKYKELQKNKPYKMSGKEKLLQILKKSDFDTQESILSEIESNDRDLADELRSSIFTFKDLINVPKKEMEKILNNFDNKEVAFLLKGADDNIKTIFFTCVATRRKKQILQEMEYLGPVKKKDVQEMRRNFIREILELEKEGTVILRPDNEIYVE